MSLRYDFYSTPSPKESEGKTRLHARVVPVSTTTTERMVELISSSSTLSTADAKAALIAFTEAMAKELASGRRVHLEGLGYFELTLSCPPVYSTREIRAESIHVKSISFRPEAGFKKRFKVTPVERVREKRHSRKRTDEEIEVLLKKFFNNHPYMTGRQFRYLCGFTRTTAARRLKQLVVAGKLRKTGQKIAPMYELV